MEKGKIIIYKSKSDDLKVDVHLVKETVWLTINQMAKLFSVDKSGISRHINNIYQTGELPPKSTVAKFATVQKEGKREVKRELEYYNPDWAVVFEVDKRVYFVAESKGTIHLDELRETERMKIKCGEKHFDEFADVEFKAPVSNVSEMVAD